MKLLLVDDDAVQLRTLRTQMIRAGYEVVEAPDGQSAWEILQKEPVQFVIARMHMSGIDGVQLIRRIREADFPNYVYIILLTDQDVQLDSGDMPDTGADDYLVGPFDVRELRSRIAIGLRILNLEARLRESLTEMQSLAAYDSLTKLLNRHAVYEYARMELSRVTPESGPMSLVLLDIAHFRHINEQYGHAVGDQILRLVADTIEENIRPYDWAGRWGGDEFLLVLPGTGPGEAHAVAERIRSNVLAAHLPLPESRTLTLDTIPGVVSVSPDTPSDIKDLIRQVEQALQHSQHQT